MHLVFFAVLVLIANRMAAEFCAGGLTVHFPYSSLSAKSRRNRAERVRLVARAPNRMIRSTCCLVLPDALLQRLEDLAIVRLPYLIRSEIPERTRPTGAVGDFLPVKSYTLQALRFDGSSRRAFSRPSGYEMPFG